MFSLSTWTHSLLLVKSVWYCPRLSSSLENNKNKIYINLSLHLSTYLESLESERMDKIPRQIPGLIHIFFFATSCIQYPPSRPKCIITTLKYSLWVFFFCANNEEKKKTKKPTFFFFTVQNKTIAMNVGNSWLLYTGCTLNNLA